MKNIPWKGIALGCLTLTLLVAARSAVTAGKAIYYGYDWVTKLVEDPWFIVGIAAAIVGVAALIVMGCQQKKKASEEEDMVLEEAPEAQLPPETE